MAGAIQPLASASRRRIARHCIAAVQASAAKACRNRCIRAAVLGRRRARSSGFYARNSAGIRALQRFDQTARGTPSWPKSSPTSRSRARRRRSRSRRSAPSSASRPSICCPTATTRRRSRPSSSPRSAGNKDGKLILVTAINPTPAGEGKTTTTVGLGDGLNRIGKKAVVCIREASLGPEFRHQGRCGRRRLCAGRADGGHEPPLHRRLPRHHHRPQPFVGADRQPHLLGQRARHRHPPRRLAARHGHERPGAARDHRARSAASPTAFRARPASTSRWPRR